MSSQNRNPHPSPDTCKLLCSFTRLTSRWRWCGTLWLLILCSLNVVGSPGELKWSLAIPGGHIYGPPTMATNGDVLIGASDGKLHAVTPDGAVRWSFSTPQSVVGMPMVGADGTIYFGSDKLYALNPEGMKLWEFDQFEWTDNYINYMGPPVLGPDGAIYVTRIASGDQPRLFVLEPDRTVRWILKRRFSGPVVLGKDGTIFLSEDHGYFSAVNPDGVVRWTTTVGGWATSSGTPVANGAVLVPVAGSSILEGAIQAFTATGSNLWRFEGGSPAIGTPVIGPDGAAYGVFNAGHIVAFETNGSVRWDYQTEDLPNTYPNVHAPALAADGTLYVTSEQWLYALNASGQLLWRYDAGRSELGAPLLGPGGTIYFSANGETNVLFAVEGTGAGLAASSWPMGRRDARHSASLAAGQTIPPAPTGLAASDFTDKVLLNWNSAPPATHYQVWRSATPNYAEAVVITNGLSGGVSYADRSCIPGETNYYFVRAANAAGMSPIVGPVAGQRRVANVGEAVWIVPTGGAVGSAAAIGPDGTAYFGDSDGKLHAVDGAGQLQWSFTFGGASSTPPAVGADGTVYFAAATTFYPHPIPNALFAVTPTGQLLWRLDVPESSVNSPAIGADGTLYFALETRLLALSPTGSNVWTFTNGRSFFRTPAIGADGTIYCGTTDGYLVAIAPNGVQLWESSSVDGYLRTPVIDDNGVLFTAGGNFHAFNPDGQKLWSYALTSGSSSGPSLLTTQGVVYAQAEKTYFRFSTNGSNVHKFILPAAQDNSQARVVADANAIVYVSVYNGIFSDALTAKIYAMSAAGVKQWEYSIFRGGFGNPTLGANNLLLVPAADGLHALRTSAGMGTSAWPHPLHDPQHTARSTQMPPLPAAPVASATLRTRITDVRVSWNSVLAASSYEVFRSDTANSAEAVLLSTVIGQLFYDDKSATPETDYFYWVKAKNVAGSSPLSAPVVGVRRQAVAGEILYRWPIGTPVNGSLAIGADGTIYATGGKKIMALNPDGTVQWEHPVSWPVLSSPTLGPDGTIYVGAQATLNQTLSPSPLLALNPDGSELWRFTATNNIRGTPAVGADGTIYFTTDSISASQPGVLYALSPNGNLLWSLPLSRVTDASVAIARDGTLYVFTRDGRLSAVTSTGIELWNVAAGAAPGGETLRPSPAIGADGTIFVSGGALRAFLPDGRLRWQTTNGTFYSSPTIAPDGSVLVSSQEGWIHLVRDGTNVWRYRISAVNRGAAAFATPNLIYAPGPAGQLLTLTLAGSNVWQAPVGSLWSTSPTIAPDGTIYVSTAEGEVVSVFGEAPLADTPWPMFQHDIRHTGRHTSPAIAPSLLTQPASLTVRQGAPVNLAVDVAGYPWPAFQWYLNDAALLGATARNLSLLSVLPSDAGTYRVTATNEAGQLSSSNALLTILPCAAVPAGAVAWWPGESNLFDSASVNDLGLNNQTLSSNTFLAGKSGLGFRLTNNSYLTTAYSEELDLGAGAGLTVEGWIKPDSIATAQPLVEWNDGVSRIGAGLMINPAYGAGALEAWFADTNSIPSRTVRVSAASAGIVSNVWQHVALTFDQATGMATIYAGGVPLTQTNLGTFRPLTGTPVYLGYRRAGGFMGSYFRGGLDEFALYDRALSAAEIQAIVTADDGGKCLPPPSCAPPTFNLVAWWRGESNALDQVNGNHGVITQTISFTNGAVGNAFQFSTGVIRVGGNSNLNVGLYGGFTVEGWFRTAVPGFQPLLEWNSGTGTQGVTLATSTTRALQANLIDTNGVAHVFNSPQQILTNGTWQHLALTYDRASGIAAWYRSGLRVAQTNLGSFVPRTDGDFFLGYRPVGPYVGSGAKYTGAMDEISLYARALSPAEIRAVMRSRGEGKCLSAPTVSRFTHAALQPNGQLRLRMVGTFPFTAQIQSSTNLIDWQSIGVPQPAAGGEFVFEDVEPTSLPARYYRLISP
jgi:sugar lactone lactonase YvrE